MRKNQGESMVRLQETQAKWESLECHETLSKGGKRPYSVMNRQMHVCSKIAPGFRIVDGKLGWFTASG